MPGRTHSRAKKRGKASRSKRIRDKRERSLRMCLSNDYVDENSHVDYYNRKRGRNIREDEVEFMPLSKRINNLHINGNLFFDAQSTEWGPGPPCYGNGSYSVPDTPPEPIQNFNNVAPQYNPVLNASENPHYFYKNKLLFEMHLERMQRSNH